MSYFIGIAKNFGGRDSDHLVASPLQALRACLVALWPVAGVVRDAIKLNNELGFRAIQIGAIPTNGVLLSKRDALGRAAETLPKQYFRQAHLFARAPGLVNLGAA